MIVLFDDNKCKLSFDDLIQFIHALFIIFVTDCNVFDESWIIIWNSCLEKLKMIQMDIIQHWSSID